MIIGNVFFLLTRRCESGNLRNLAFICHCVWKWGWWGTALEKGLRFSESWDGLWWF